MLAELVAGGVVSGPSTVATAAVMTAGATTAVAPVMTTVAPAVTMVAPVAAVANAATPRVSVMIRWPRRTPTLESFPSRDGIEILEVEPQEVRAPKRHWVEKARALDNPREVSEALDSESCDGDVPL
jgi:hypothetical protein